MASKLRVDHIEPVGGIPTGGGGGIIQMVTGSGTTRIERGNNTGTYYNTYINATITPKFATSKILAVATGDVQVQANTTGGVSIHRGDTAGDNSATNGTQLSGGSYAIANYGGATVALENIPLTAIAFDSPATTSATKYTVTCARTAGSNSAFCPGNNGSNPFKIYLFEVSG